MPTYDYACQDCGEVREFDCGTNIVHKVECLKCGAMAVKIFTAPTIVQTGYKPGDARFNRGRGK
jgi:putative FmdB family regulatory protein